MRQFHALTTLVLIATFLWPSVSVRAAVPETDAVPAAVVYLRVHATDDPEWAALALRAADEIATDVSVSSATDGAATDLARRILALAAIGADPRPLADALEAKVVNGSVEGDSYLNDDTFAVLALVAAGRSLTADPLATIAAFLRSVQQSDGGWGVTTLSRSDVDSTAAALQALWLTGERGDVVTRGLTYLRGQQNTDAGFPFRKPSASNSASTAWALSTLGALGESLANWQVSGLDPRQFLLATQQPDGGFSYQPSSATSTVLLTSYAVLGLRGRGFVVARYSPPQPPAEEPPPSSPPSPLPPPLRAPPVAPAPAESTTVPAPILPVSSSVAPSAPAASAAQTAPVPAASPTVSVQPRHRCRIKGDVVRRGRRVVRRYYLATTRGYRRVRIRPRQGDRWFCSATEARRAGFRLATRR